MHTQILWAEMAGKTVSFHGGLNLLYGQGAEDAVLTLAAIFGGTAPQNARAQLLCNGEAVLTVSLQGSACTVEGCCTTGDSGQMVKAFHKQRCVHHQNRIHLLDGSSANGSTLGAGTWLLERLATTLMLGDGQPLFICNFLERLDEAVAAEPILEALANSGRQVFLAEKLPRSFGAALML